MYSNAIQFHGIITVTGDDLSLELLISKMVELFGPAIANILGKKPGNHKSGD